MKKRPLGPEASLEKVERRRVFVVDEDDAAPSVAQPEPALELVEVAPAAVQVGSGESDDSDVPLFSSAPRERRAPTAGAVAVAGSVRSAMPEPVPSVDSPTFAQLGLAPWLCESLRSLGMHQPTPIQCGCVPPAIAGRDVIGCAETGSGKTLAFGLPILQKLGADPYGIMALILTPARELAVQIAEQLQAVGAPLRVNVCTIIGGMSQMQQSLAVSRKPHVVVATPGRAAALVKQGALSLNKLAFLVMDEADRLLFHGFERDLTVIIGAACTKRQTMLFSATMTPTLEVLQSMSMRDPVRWDQTTAGGALATVKRLRQDYILVPADARDAYLVYLVRVYSSDNVALIVFCPSVEECALVFHMLDALVDVPCVQLHSMMRQEERTEAMSRYRSGEAKILVATDVASRGLDIPSTDLVINASCPPVVEDYVHRVGRTARAGRDGLAITLVTQHEVALLLNIEDRIGLKLAEHPTDEQEVLQFLSEANAARRLSQVWWQQSGDAAKHKRRKASKNVARKDE